MFDISQKIFLQVASFWLVWIDGIIISVFFVTKGTYLADMNGAMEVYDLLNASKPKQPFLDTNNSKKLGSSKYSIK